MEEPVFINCEPGTAGLNDTPMLDNAKKPGTWGGKDAKLTDENHIVLDIKGRDGPVFEGVVEELEKGVVNSDGGEEVEVGRSNLRQENKSSLSPTTIFSGLKIPKGGRSTGKKRKFLQSGSDPEEEEYQRKKRKLHLEQLELLNYKTKLQILEMETKMGLPRSRLTASVPAVNEKEDPEEQAEVKTEPEDDADVKPFKEEELEIQEVKIETHDEEIVASGVSSSENQTLLTCPEVPKTTSNRNQNIQRSQCTICGKWFPRSTNARSRLLLPSGEKPFKCSKCGWAFAQAGTWKRHQLLRSGEKNHFCSMCGGGFKTRSTLKQHLRSHSSETPYRCLHCGKEFARQSYLDDHKISSPTCRFYLTDPS